METGEVESEGLFMFLPLTILIDSLILPLSIVMEIIWKFKKKEVE